MPEEDSLDCTERADCFSAMDYRALEENSVDKILFIDAQPGQ